MSHYIIEVDPKNKKYRDELIDYLVKDEAKALFLIANLVSNFTPSFIYVAMQNDRIVGVCGYYPTFKSCSIYAETDEASRILAKKVISIHSISALLGMKTMILPAYKEFLKKGMKSITNPQHVFFELDMKNFKPFFTQDGKIISIEKNDINDAVLLLRYLNNIPKEKPITNQEQAKVLATSEKFCLKIDEKMVSIASSNGLAIKAFQILGVVSHPDYRKKGYAKAVCSYLISHMKDKGANKAIIFTKEDNIAAKKCYLDLGFQIVDKYYFATFGK
jgi:ribosomal protein S18 acetylase RimI-like enzyme